MALPYVFMESEYMRELETIKTVVAKPGQFASIEEIPHVLEAMQSIVEGRIEIVYPWNDNVALLCNEDGKNIGLPLNRVLYDSSNNILDTISGTFLIVGLGEENFRSLTNEEAEKYYNEFRKPEFWVKKIKGE